MQSTQAKYPKIGYSWTIDYPVQGRAFSLAPTEKHLVLTHSVNVPASQYILKGCTGVNLVGSLNPSFLPVANRGCLMGTGFMKGPSLANEAGLGGRPLSEFTQEQCTYVADNFLNARGGYRYLCSQAEEAYGSDEPWKLSASLIQSTWIAQALSAKVQSQGGKYYHTYDGHLAYLTITSAMLAVLDTPAHALAFCKANANFGNKFFSGDHYLFRNGIIKSYYMGGTPGGNFGQLINMFAINNRALEAEPNNAKVITVGWLNFHEQEGYSKWYRRAVPNTDGYYEASDWPLQSFPYSCALVFLALIMLEGFYGWEAEYQEGRDPTIVAPDEIDPNPWLTQKYYGSGNPPRGGVTQQYSSTFVYQYPTAPKGGFDAGFVAGWWFRAAHDWSGSAWQYLRVKTNVGGTYFDADSVYPTKAFLESTGYAFGSRTGTRQTVFYFNDKLAPGVFVDMDFELLAGGGTLTKTVTGGIPYVWYIDTAA